MPFQNINESKYAITKPLVT